MATLMVWAMGRDPVAAQPTPAYMAPDQVGWDLPLTRNAQVDRWIDFLTGRNAARTRLWLERSGRYGPMIRAQLRARGMPQDLFYLAFVESGLSPSAHSSAAAAGIWQFIAETGQRYGLEVGSYLDERRDPIKSTEAAIDYLQVLYGRFGSWYLAAAAYNTGENRVDRILRERAGGRRGDEKLFWRIAPYLPQETRDYVPLMLAAGYVGKNPARYGFRNLRYHQPLAFDTAWVPSQVSLDLVARAAGVGVETLKELNPHLTRGVTPPGRRWAVRVPSGSHIRFAANLPGLYRREYSSERARAALAVTRLERHRVRRGETLSHLALRYDTSVSRLQSLNGLGQRSRIYVGQWLRVK